MADIKSEQKRSKANPPKDAIEGADGIQRVKSRIWIPEELAPTIVAIAHGITEHPGINTLLQFLNKHF